MSIAQGLRRAGTDPSTAAVFIITTLGALWSLFAAAYAPDAAMRGQSWLILGGFLTGIIMLVGVIANGGGHLICICLKNAYFSAGGIVFLQCAYGFEQLGAGGVIKIFRWQAFMARPQASHHIRQEAAIRSTGLRRIIFGEN